MKRNSLFMLSYIIFLFIAKIVRYFWEYPIWSALVVATTIASTLFAISDLCLSTVREEEILSNDAMCFKEKCSSKIKEMKKMLNKIQDLEKTCQGYKISSEVKEYETKVYVEQELKKLKSDIKKEIGVMGNFMEEIGKYERKWWIYLLKIISSCMYVIGVVLFFLILTFKPLSLYLSVNIEQISVTAFLTILTMQYFENISSNFIHKCRRNHDNIVKNMCMVEEIYNMCLYDLSNMLLIAWYHSKSDINQ